VDQEQSLESRAIRVRREIVRMTALAASGHPGGSLSCVEILLSLYANARYDANDPSWEGRDRIVISKGHASPAVYAVLAEFGFITRESLATYRKLGGLPGHSTVKTPGVEFPAGSLGLGVGFGNGLEFARRFERDINGRDLDYHTFVVVGDGEMQEGSIQEGLETARHHGLDTIVIVDVNRVQNDDWVEKTKALDLEAKFKACGWSVEGVDGHNFRALRAAIGRATLRDGTPNAILAKTVKGKGVSFMENNPRFHGSAPNKEEFAAALKELDAAEARIAGGSR
jgi:transketolase